MTIPTTKVGAAQDGLLVLLQARAGLQVSGLIVALGWPPTTPQANAVWIEGDVAVWTVEELSTGVGPRARWERFTIPVRCVRLHSSNDYQTTRNEALAYVGEVDQAVRGDRTLGGSVDDCEVAGGTVTEIKADDGRGLGVMFTLHVECQAALNG